MPLRVTRRPYTTCPFRYSLTVAGVSTSEGDVSDAQCADLNGTFDLDFKSCISRGRTLVWETECEPSSGNCPTCNVTFSVALPEITMTCPVLGVVTYPTHTYRPSFLASRNLCDCDYLDSVQGPFDCTGVFCKGYVGITVGCGVPSQLRITLNEPNNGGIGAIYYSRAGSTCANPGTFDYGFTVVPDIQPPCDSEPVGGWPATLDVASVGGGGATGPETNDRTRGKYRVEYDTIDEEWTLHSFERVAHPRWTLIDADPCDGNEKILTLEPAGNVANGCFVAPATVTITRACAPERAAREHKRSTITGQLKRPCGCACDDEVDDRRHTCQAKCEDITTAGCETWGADQIACKFPASSDCCTYCPEDTAPCAYEALTTCDLSYNGIPIMAKTVTLRHKCYFKDSFDWMAVGPSPNPEDGGLGAQPVCATCADTCLTGCSWDAWQTASCTENPYCASPEYAAIVASRTGKCLRLTWGSNTSGHTDPPGYSLGGLIDVFTPSSQSSQNGVDFATGFTSPSGWTLAGHPFSPAPNDAFGCGNLKAYTPNTAEWIAWSNDNLHPFGGWLAGHSNGWPHYGSITPWAASPIVIESNTFAPNDGTITILAEWIDCP